MFFTTPSRIWPSFRPWISSVRCSARVSSSTARRDTTMLPRARSILRIWNGCGAAHQRADVAHRADIDLAAGQERHGAAEIDGEAALDPAVDRAVDAGLRLERLLEVGPGFLAPRLLARQDDGAVLVLVALDVEFDEVAGLDFRLGAGRGEFLAAATRPSDFRPTSTMAYSSVRRWTRPVTTEPSKLVSRAEGFIEQGGEVLAAEMVLGRGRRDGAGGGGCCHMEVVFRYGCPGWWPGGCRGLRASLESTTCPRKETAGRVAG